MTYTRCEIAVGNRPTLFGDDVIYLDLRDCGIRPFVQHDMTLPLPFEDEQFSHIQAMHCLEHVCYADTDRVLAQWAAKLAHRGILHIEVPDVAYQAQRILANPLDDEAIVMMYGTQVDMDPGMNQHRTAFTAQLLLRGLERAGLKYIWVAQVGGCLVAEGRRMVEGRKPKISVVNVTRRRGGIDVLLENLRRQTILNDLLAENRIELIVVDEHAKDPMRQVAVKMIHDVLLIPTRHVYPEDYPEPTFCKLARANNTALSIASGDVLWIVNDYVYCPPNTLEVMLETLESLSHEALLTTICHHAASPTLEDIGDLTDTFTIFKTPFHADDYGFPDVPISWRDPRVDQPAVSQNPFMWEANVGLVRVDLLKRGGWWVEAFDQEGISGDNVVMALNTMMATPGTQVVVVPVECLVVNHYVLLPNAPEQVQGEAKNQELLRNYLAERGVRMG